MVNEGIDQIHYDSSEEANRIAIYQKAAIHYIRKGYMKAQNRFRDAWAANSMFINIAAAVDPYCNPEYEGQEFKLTYTRNKATCMELDNYDY